MQRARGGEHAQPHRGDKIAQSKQVPCDQCGPPSPGLPVDHPRHRNGNDSCDDITPPGDRREGGRQAVRCLKEEKIDAQYSHHVQAD